MSNDIRKMRVGIIGRSELLFNSMLKISASNYEIAFIVTAKESPEYKVKREDFQNYAEQKGIPYASSANILEHKKIFLESGADVVVSVNYPGIIPDEIIDMFDVGILNAHGGDLPRYRGNACQAWAILNGEERIGLCVHKMVGGELDSGDIISRKYLNISNNTKISTVFDWMSAEIPELFLDALEKLNNDREFILERQSSSPKHHLRCFPRNKDDGKINWSASSLEVLRLVNASGKPFFGAFTYFEGDLVKIFDVNLVEYKGNICAIPGQVVQKHADSVDVACGAGIIRIFECEVNGEMVRANTLVQSLRSRFVS